MLYPSLSLPSPFGKREIDSSSSSSACTVALPQSRSVRPSVRPFSVVTRHFAPRLLLLRPPPQSVTFFVCTLLLFFLPHFSSLHYRVWLRAPAPLPPPLSLVFQAPIAKHIRATEERERERERERVPKHERTDAADISGRRRTDGGAAAPPEPPLTVSHPSVRALHAVAVAYVE